MIDFVVEHLSGPFMGGVIVGLWIVARDRRKAVDRFNGILHERPEDAAKGKVHAEIIEAVKAAGRTLTPTHKGGPSQDAAGRVIARSVKRMTK